MIQELNSLRGYGKNVELELKDGLLTADHLTAWSFGLYKSMPLLFQQQFATIKDSYGNVTPEVQAQIDAIKKSIVDLETQKSQLFGEAQIRPRNEIITKNLPASK